MPARAYGLPPAKSHQMAPTEGKRVPKRVSLPSPETDEVINLSVELLAARCSGVFGRGFRLRAIGRRLYVQITGRKVPLYLDFDADPVEVQERALALLRFRHEHGKEFDADGWRDAVGEKRAKTGKAQGGPKRDMTREEVIETWTRFKLAQGVTQSTIDRCYAYHLRRLDPTRPLSDASLLGVIEQIGARSLTRKRVVRLTKQLCDVCGYPWNARLLEPLRNPGSTARKKPQAFFSDAEIIELLQLDISDSWRRVITLLAVYGLRPWEAFVAERSKTREECVWIPKGKTNSRGTTPPRHVPPFHPGWFDSLEVTRLWACPLPEISSLSKAGVRLNQYLGRRGVLHEEGKSSYGFRHAYARRLHSPEYRVTDAHASLFMGHTVAVHHRVYQDWLGESDPIGIYLDCPG
jgi:hypothetical protein